MGGRVEERMVFEADNICIIQGKEEFVTKMLLSDVKCSLTIAFSVLARLFTFKIITSLSS